MSFNLGVWYPDRQLSPEEAGARYKQLCEGDARDVTEHPAVGAFYDELVATHPEIDDIPDERVDDHEYCPWSITMDRSPGHIVMCCVWSRAEYVRTFVGELASKHGLVLYDPQEGTVTFPPVDAPAKRPWWKFW